MPYYNQVIVIKKAEYPENVVSNLNPDLIKS